jgi:hypothetical protein
MRWARAVWRGFSRVASLLGCNSPRAVGWDSEEEEEEEGGGMSLGDWAQLGGLGMSMGRLGCR